MIDHGSSLSLTLPSHTYDTHLLTRIEEAKEIHTLRADGALADYEKYQVGFRYGTTIDFLPGPYVQLKKQPDISFMRAQDAPEIYYSHLDIFNLFPIGGDRDIKQTSNSTRNFRQTSRTEACTMELYGLDRTNITELRR